MAKGSQCKGWEAWLRLPETGDFSHSSTDDWQTKYSDVTRIACYEKEHIDTVELSCLFLLSLFSYPVTTNVLLDTLSGLKLPTDERLLQWNHSTGLRKLLSKLLEDDQLLAGIRPC